MAKQEKRCPACQTFKPHSEFYKNQKYGNGLHYQCKPCDAKAEFKGRLKRKYGITPEDYETLLQQQSGVCAICLEVGTRKLSVDHCHRTGKIRALLCQKCNSAIGLLNEDTDLMRKAITYLETHNG